jgi:anti-sigma B factor antagonist
VNSSEQFEHLRSTREDPAVPSDGHNPIPSTTAIEIELRPVRALGYAALVSLAGEHDLATSDELVAALAPLAGNVLVDLSTCEFIDSTVIGAVIAKSADLARDGHRLELVVPPANRIVTRVVDVVGLRALVTVYEQVPGTTV